MPHFETAERRLFYQWSGSESGPVLVLSHSLGASHQVWTPQVKVLGATYRILLYDHRGHGQSSHPPGEWTIADFGQDLIELLDFLELDRVSLCGLSLGGMVGLWMGQEASERVEKLVVANCSARIEDPTLLRSRTEQIRKDGLESIAENVLDRWFTVAFRASNRETVEEIRQMLSQTTTEGYAATCEALCEMDLMDGLDRIQTPSLIIYGKHDHATPPEWTHQFAKQMPSAQMVELESAHLSNREDPEGFNAAVLDFLS